MTQALTVTSAAGLISISAVDTISEEQPSANRVLINLDTHAHDFKFWMAHELGHAKAPDLRGDDAENFADMFAGA